MNRSIRFTLTLWYVGILSATLCLFGWVFYDKVAADLLRDTDQMLALQANGVADTILAFWQARSGAPRDAAFARRTIQQQIEEGKFPALLRRWAQETGELETEDAVRLLDRNGLPLETSPNFQSLSTALAAADLTRARHGHAVYETSSLAGTRLRNVIWPVLVGKQVLYLVQSATSLKQMDESLQRLRVWLLWLIPLTLAVASVVGWFLATTALRPVGRMITQAQRIGAEHLHERIDVSSTGDELELLGTTFNDMLGRLEQAFRRMRQFSAAASHELRTPLTIMKGELEVALRRPRDNEEYQRVLRTQLEALNEMANTVEQLLALARSEGGKGALEWFPVELGALARQMQEVLRPVAEGKNIRVEVHGAENVWVRGEKHLLMRLMGNLLNNAIHHTPNQGLVTVESVRRENEACLIVQDTGPGISAEELPSIFDKFFSRTVPREEEGSRSTGLGLGLCRWIAEAHHGHIEAASLPGKGAIFTVHLPLSS